MNKQAIFRELVLGTLVYSVVLGFFNDYTDIISTRSYSTTFLVALVLQLLTFVTLRFKDRVKGWFARRAGRLYRFGFAFTVWLIMFLSKFVFLEVLYLFFNDSLEISGFLGILAIIVTMMIVEGLLQAADRRLA